MDCLTRNTTQNSTKIWRPWDEDTTKIDPTKCKRLHPYVRHPTRNQMQSNFHPLQSYVSTFEHPVRLYWTKAAYDYMYEAGERLLRNFPVQATIQVVDDSDSSDDEDDDDDEYENNEDKKKEDDTKDIIQEDKGNKKSG
ncbi:protein ripply1-like [Actinia tenebrosa]|uniref:Protein ripply1-like n=1 Tax=Actinia tenebrosa TaxID=6105 RepID=A0A6P8ILV1_ACTTE|nr:protein ripply1-like [Actinia tenebrosa]XP_031567799.1 protein ripply1-like [Actinia tenebrosa]